MKLFTFFNSSASYRVRIVLALKGIDYDALGVNIRNGEQFREDYLRRNPMAVVPTLITDNGQDIGQSLAIIDYLDRRYPAPLLVPDDERQRAQVLEIALAIACDIHPVNNMRVLRYLSDELKVSDAEKKRWYAHWIEQGLSAVERLLEQADSGDYCVGGRVTLADCCLIPQWANAKRMGCELSAYPRCQRVYQHCTGLPAFIAAAPEHQADVIPV
ncbi:maleylacetoacetate isomerase [Enterobacillus tribolii]|uniref:Maleylacetoacetate isomerase n=1 Tax=Enterobacillus tribolii TaxID=1487935 RepID=A0A370R453_9GAMM|nr:maleylacetoacetate isomerase [Enterobacillus tribolii]MBW7983143.1 maleylacetoacetate isomerase [Enterobacillus tribolii]RDK97198.1 maleylacetoacetate isomerase [Enterobacillus tribolii]